MHFAKEIRQLPAMIKDSAKEVRKVSSICGCSMMTALSVVISLFRIQISNILRISFDSIAIGVSGMLYGPLLSGFAGAISDILKFMMRPDGPYFPGFMLNEFIVGFVYGCFFYKKEITLKRVVLARILLILLLNFVLTPIWLNVIYGTPLLASVRLTKNLIMFPIDVALLYTVLKIAKRIRSKA